MRISVNGESKDLADGATVAALVASYQFNPKHVAVEVNCDLVSRQNYAQTTLQEGDRVEIVTLVGGG